MRRIISALLGAFFALLLIAQPALASENFDTTLHSYYTVLVNGSTRVRHEFVITNKKPLFTVSQYGLKLSSTDISNVTVTSGDQALDAEVVTTDNQTSIGITFPDRVVGQGKQRKFSISYTNPDIALISGQVLEVAIPKLNNSDEYIKYSVSLVTPRQYNLPSKITPTNFKTDIGDTNITTTFETLENDSITALFGNSQIFDLTLRYNLENPTSGTKLIQVAFPPDTPFQKMYYQSVDPLPQDIESDRDGNWIATYQLPGNSTTVVLINAQAHLTLGQNTTIPSALPTQDLLKPQEYWNTNHSTVTSLASQLNSPRETYDYVVEKLSYNYDRLNGEITRLGAVQALENPDQALCQEFTDVFVALTRAAGFPARRVTGYAYTENSTLRPLSLVADVLHTWPEYHDSEKGIWVPVDPTWENTSGGINYFDQFDLNHIVFAINGHSSVTPFPAGSYKSNNLETKDVEVKFGTQIQQQSLDLSFSLESLPIFGLPIPGRTVLAITNNSGQAHYNLQVVAANVDPSVAISPDNSITLDKLLPYQTQKVPFQVKSLDSLTDKKVQIIFSYEGQEKEVTLKASSSAWEKLYQPQVLLGLVVASLVIALGAGSLLVFKQRRDRALRGQG